MRHVRAGLVITIVSLELALLGVGVAASATDDSRTDGVTLCLPVVGPVQRLAANLPDNTRRVVQVHEAVHAIQCRLMGAPLNFLERVTIGGRLRIEGEAYCAQIRYEVAQGAARDLVFARAVDELVETIPPRAFGRLGEDSIRTRFAMLCPDVGALEVHPTEP